MHIRLVVWLVRLPCKSQQWVSIYSANTFAVTKFRNVLLSKVSGTFGKYWITVIVLTLFVFECIKC